MRVLWREPAARMRTVSLSLRRCVRGRLSSVGSRGLCQVGFPVLRLWGCVSAPARQDVQDAPAHPSRQAGPPDGVLGNCFEPFPPLDGTLPAQILVPDS